MKIHPLIQQALAGHPKGIRISLGCGDNVPSLNEGWVGIDLRPIPGAVRHDLEKLPWPIPDACANLITAACILPHLNPARMGVVKFMNEVWRILKPNGKLMLSTPYGVNSVFLADPTHCAAFTENSFYYFDPLHKSNAYTVYRPLPWKIEIASFQLDGMMEIGMSKRRIDESYKVSDEWLGKEVAA